MNLLLIYLVNTYMVVLQSKGGVRCTTNVVANSSYQARQLTKNLYSNKTIIIVKKQNSNGKKYQSKHKH